MFFHELELRRCKRFSLRGIETLRIKPDLKTQMVLGSNGAGKSSLLKVGFSVLPAQGADFFKGGSKTIRLSHNGRLYELSTIFEKSSPEHGFICDGEQLNQGRTGAVQKELVREHFGMTQEIHDVLTGEEKFTAMSPLRRREWITMLSDTDFTYVLNLYTKVKKGANFASSVVKRNNDRLVNESGKLMSPDDLVMIVNRSKELRGELDVLLQECSNTSDNVSVLSNSLLREFRELESFITSVVKRTNLTPPDHEWIRDMDALKRAIARIDNETSELEGVLSELGKVSQHFEAQMKNLETIEGLDEAFIRNKIGTLTTELNELVSRLRTGEQVVQIVHDTRSLGVIDEYRKLVYGVSSSLREQYTDQVVNEQRQLLDRLHVARNTLTTRLGNLQGRLQHIETCQESGCPQCGHRFKIGVVDGEYEKLKEMAVTGEEKANDFEQQIQTCSEFIHGANTYQQLLNSIHRFRQGHPEMANFWGYIDRQGGMEQGRELIPAINLYLADAEIAGQIQNLTNQLKPLKEAIASIEELSGESSSIREQYYLYASRINETTEEIRIHRRTAQALVDYQNRQERFDRDLIDLEAKLLKVYGLQDELIEAIRQSEIRGLIKDNQVSLAMVETALTETEMQEGIVNDIRKEIDTMSIEEQAYKVLDSILSPTDGLIAEQIRIYINAIIDRMNAVIARIWGYNMAIKPCDIQDGDLNYRFPLYTVTDDNDIPDVSKGSTSQVDIVNQAFRLIVYKFLNLNGYPLYLDELGSSFDEVHRHNLVPAIKDLIDDSTYSQIFMISHYVDGQNSYPNSEIIVLDDSHVNIKRSYNEHVQFA